MRLAADEAAPEMIDESARTGLVLHLNQCLGSELIMAATGAPNSPAVPPSS